MGILDRFVKLHYAIIPENTEGRNQPLLCLGCPCINQMLLATLSYYKITFLGILLG